MEYAYYLGPDLSPSRVEQDYGRPAWAREIPRPSWTNADPTRRLHYAQPISTTPRVQPEYLQERVRPIAHEQPRQLPGNQPPINHATKTLPNFEGDSAKVQGFLRDLR